jgi:hypothetical protein
MAKTVKIKASHLENSTKPSKALKNASKLSKEKNSKKTKKKSVEIENSEKPETKKLTKKSPKMVKKVTNDDEVASSLKQELVSGNSLFYTPKRVSIWFILQEVFIKNLNKSGDLQKHFVIDDKDFEKIEDNDEILSTEDYEDDYDGEDEDDAPGETNHVVEVKVAYFLLFSLRAALSTKIKSLN